MADDNKVQVQVSAQADDFNQGMQAAVSKLSDSINQMLNMFSGMNNQVSSAMGQAAASTNQAATTMSDSMRSSTGQISSSIDSLKNAVGTFGISIVTAFGAAAKSTLNYELSLLQLSRTSGLNIEESSKLAYSASQYGVAVDDLGRNIGIMSRNLDTMQKSTDTTSSVFSRFNITVADGNGKLLPTDQILGNIADRFKSMPDGVEKTAMSMEIFGRRGKDMILLMNQGSEGLEKMGVTAEKLGLVMHDTSDLYAYIAAQRQWQATLQGLEHQMGEAVLPVLTAFSKAITSALQAFNSLDPGIRQTVISVAAVTGAVAALTFGWGAMTAALTALGGPFASVGGMMAGMPNLITSTVNGLSGLITGLADATIAFVKYIATGGLFTTASNAMNAVMAATTTFMSGVRTAVLATSLAYSTGGVTSIAQYCASLISMNSVIAVARTALMLLYATVTAGIAVVVALGLAWIGNFGDIQNATAGICDGISYGLNTFANGVKQWASGIADIFASLAKAISSAFVGDFQGAWNAVKGIGSGIVDMAQGFGTAFQGVGQAAYAAITNPGGAWNYAKAAGGALWSGAKNMMGFGPAANGGVPEMPGGNPDFSGAANSDETAYEQKKRLYEEDVALHNYTQAEKLQKYKEYLADVTKLEKEQLDYVKGLKELEVSARKEQLQMERIDLETRVAEGKASEGELLKQKIATATEAVKAEREGTLEYKKLLKEKVEAEREYFDWQYEQLQKQLERQKAHNDSIVALEEEKIRHLKALGLITDEEEAKAKAALDEQNYNNQKAEIEKQLQFYESNNLTELQKYKDLKDQKAALDEQWKVKAIQNSNAIKEAQLKNILEVKNSMTNSLSQAFQDIIKGSKGLLSAITSVFQSIGNTILKQFTDRWAKTITDKLFGGILGGNNKGPDQTRVAQETATQAAITGVATAGNTARLTAAKAANMAAGASGAASATAIVTANAAAFTALLAMISAMAAAVAAIPPDGPALAAAMTAGVGAATGVLTGATSAATAAIASSMSGVASFDVGTWSVPQDMLAMVHKGEPIIPAPFADSARKVLSGEMIPAAALDGAGGGYGDIHIHNSYSAIDGKGMKGIIKKHSSDIADNLAKVNRGFYRPKK
jgi:hypothetical protein